MLEDRHFRHVRVNEKNEYHNFGRCPIPQSALPVDAISSTPVLRHPMGCRRTVFKHKPAKTTCNLSQGVRCNWSVPLNTPVHCTPIVDCNSGRLAFTASTCDVVQPIFRRSYISLCRLASCKTGIGIRGINAPHAEAVNGNCLQLKTGGACGETND